MDLRPAQELVMLLRRDHFIRYTEYTEIWDSGSQHFYPTLPKAPKVVKGVRTGRVSKQARFLVNKEATKCANFVKRQGHLLGC